MLRHWLLVAMATSLVSYGSSASAQDLPRTHFKVVGLQSHLNSFKTGEKAVLGRRASRKHRRARLPATSRRRISTASRAPKFFG